MFDKRFLGAHWMWAMILTQCSLAANKKEKFT